MARMREQMMEVVGRWSSPRPTGPQWEEQITKFRHIDSGEEFLWWSDRALYIMDGQGLEVGNVVKVSATPHPGYREDETNLRKVKIHGGRYDFNCMNCYDTGQIYIPEDMDGQAMSYECTACPPQVPEPRRGITSFAGTVEEFRNFLASLEAEVEV